MRPSFYSEFTKLPGIALGAIFPTPGTLLEDELTEFESNLSIMDEAHLAFAITLLAHHAPARLVPHVLRMLEDERTGVWTAAERSIPFLPKALITDELWNAIRTAVEKRCGSTGTSWLLKNYFEN